MELQYEERSCFACILDTVLRREESRESIVSDSMPDIGTILTVSATPLLQKTWLDGEAAGCEGTVCTSVLYESDDGTTLCCIPAEIPFRCTAECGAAPTESRMNVIPQLVRADVKIINPRKVMIQVELSVRLIVYAPETVRYSTGISEAEPAMQTRLEHISFQYVSQVTEKQFSFEDDITIGGSRPAIAALLSCEVTPYCAEAKIVGSKIIFKGGVKLRLRAQSEEAGLFSELCEVPVSQVLDAGNSSEDAIVLLNLFAADREITMRDSRTLSVRLELYACASVIDRQEGSVLTDVYSTHCPSVCEEAGAQALLVTEQSEQLLPFRIQLQQELPTADVIDLSAFLGEPRQAAEREPQRRSLRLSLCLREHDGRLTHLNQSGEIELPLAVSEGTLLGEVVLTECSCVATAAGLEVRGSLLLRCAVLTQRGFRYVGAITLEEPDAGEQHPSAVLRRLREEETLWDLGKEYLASVADILAVNQISDVSEVGNRFLLIPRGR